MSVPFSASPCLRVPVSSVLASPRPLIPRQLSHALGVDLLFLQTANVTARAVDSDVFVEIRAQIDARRGIDEQYDLAARVHQRELWVVPFARDHRREAANAVVARRAGLVA